MKTTFRWIILALSLVSASVFAAGSPEPERKKDAVLESYQQASARQDWTAAATALRGGIAADPANAEYHNLYAYSLRKGPNPDMSLVFKHYNEALRLEPKHKGAHEYIGEAYLMVGNVAKAKEDLGLLDKICFFSCTEFSDLKKAIADYETRQASR